MNSLKQVQLAQSQVVAAKHAKAASKKIVSSRKAPPKYHKDTPLKTKSFNPGKKRLSSTSSDSATEEDEFSILARLR